MDSAMTAATPPVPTNGALPGVGWRSGVVQTTATGDRRLNFFQNRRTLRMGTQPGRERHNSLASRTLNQRESITKITGVTYYQYRWYDPVTGRWPSRDPIAEKGGENLYCLMKNNAIYRVERLGLLSVDVGIGGSVTIAITLGGITGGMEIGVGRTTKVNGSGVADCLQCSAAVKLGVGAGELTAGVGIIGSIGDETFVGEGPTTSNGGGINVTPPDPGVGVSGGIVWPETGSGSGIGISGGDPFGINIGLAANFYKSRTYAGKVCENRSCWDPVGVISSGKVLLRFNECVKMAIDAGVADNWGLPKTIK